MNKELAKAVIDYLEDTNKTHAMLSSKIASLAKENDNLLGHTKASLNMFKGLVNKMASAGLIDRPNEAYLTKNANESNIDEYLGKLSALIEEGAEKKAAERAISPYAVDNTPANNNNKKYTEEEIAFNNNILNLSKKA